MAVEVKRALVFDLEANGLLDETTVDYTAAPYKLKPTFKLHCGVSIEVFLTFENGVYKSIEVGETKRYVGVEELRQLIEDLKKADIIVGHNIINYDLLVLKLYFGIDFTIRDSDDGKDTFDGVELEILDTLVLSKTLNPDRKAHSVDYYGKLFKLEKIDWRSEAVKLGLCASNAARGAEFAMYHPKMLMYNERDTQLNVKILNYLLKEWGTWNWKPAFVLESQVMEIITRQSHRGFDFDDEKAREYVRDLDIKMEACRAIVEPQIPTKKPTQAQAKEYCPPKLQLKKTTGEITKVMYKWVEKHGGEAFEESEDLPAYCVVYGKKYRIPMEQVSLLTEVPAKISDTTHIKGWLVDLGWVPSSWKERDLKVDAKKQKLSDEKYEATVERYIASTIDSPFCAYRCERLGIRPVRSKEALAQALRNKLLYSERQVKVYTNPQITVGAEKDICPNLVEFQETSDFKDVKEITAYLTYRHRRNSILGGEFDPDEDDEPNKGYLSAQREDGRIPTPADTCGAGTSRFKHRLVANIPRVTSLYGMEMRSLFKVSKLFVQMGYDFDSLEAKIEAHYCIQTALESGKEDKIRAAIAYAATLTAEKPNDVHTITAAKVSAMIGLPFSRGSAKNVKYGCSYGASAARVAAIVGCDLDVAEQIFEAFWDAAKPLKDFKDELTKWWKSEGGKKFIVGIDGRKIPTRSPHALVNSAFQSAGVICAKKAMVLHDRKLRDSGMSVDFFTEDYTKKSYCQQMIAYHDEAQAELSKSLVKFKTFAPDDEGKASAEAFKTFEQETNGKVWSDIQKGSKGFYVAYSEAGQMAVEAVNESGKLFNLNVELTAGYMTGGNWGQCH